MRVPAPRRSAAVLAAVCLLSLAGCVGVAGPVPGQQVPPSIPATPYAVTPNAYGEAVTAPMAPVPGQAQVLVPQAGLPYGATCSAGFYVCALPASLPVGTQCSCPGIGAPSFGRVR